MSDEVMVDTRLDTRLELGARLLYAPGYVHGSSMSDRRTLPPGHETAPGYCNVPMLNRALQCR